MRAPVITDIMQGDGLAEYETRYFNIKDPPFRAKGDGVTDDTAVIQITIDTAAVLGGTVSIPAGTFLISSSLIVPSNVKLEGSALGTASTILLSGNIVGIDIDNTAIGVIIESLCITNTIKQGTGIYIHGQSRKIVIKSCHITNLASGIMVSGGWTINIQDQCRIYDNTIGVNIYRRDDEGETTTINIFGNNIYANDDYNIAVGEPGQANYEAGSQSSSLSIRDNMLDNKGNYIAGVANLTFEGNHGEVFGEHFVYFADFIYGASIKNNYIRDGNYGFYFDGMGYRNISIEENFFKTIVQYCIDLRANYSSVYSVKIGRNYYHSEIGGKICYPYRSVTSEIAENIFMEGDDYDSIINGHITELGTAAPVDGRYKGGSIVRNTAPTPGGIEGWKFTVLSDWGMSHSVEDTDQVDADEPTNTVTPVDITKFKQGDWIKIVGAGAGGADLSTVVGPIDFVAATFTTDPTIKTTVADNLCTLRAGTWELFGSLAGIDTLANDATPSVLNGTKFLTGGTTTITALDDAVRGQEVTIIGAHTTTQLTDGGTLKLEGNCVLDIHDSIQLIFDGTNWHETSRTNI